MDATMRAERIADAWNRDPYYRALYRAMDRAWSRWSFGAGPAPLREYEVTNDRYVRAMERAVRAGGAS